VPALPYDGIGRNDFDRLARFVAIEVFEIASSVAPARRVVGMLCSLIIS
jgi:hypothetical protein